MIKQAFKILLKEIKQENKWGEPAKVRLGKLAFDYKNEELDLKKGATIYFMGEYVKEITIDGEDYISTNHTDLICQK